MISSDRPIFHPNDDLYNLRIFAESLATSISRIKNPDGTVIAINGPWGSGKSSAINLILHYLEPARTSNKIRLIRFNPWWFNGSEGLTLAFFQELQAIFSSDSVLRKAKTAVEWLGKRVSRSASLISAAVDLATMGVGGELAEGLAQSFGDSIAGDKSIEQIHSEIAAALNALDGRLLIVIDDIDRLAPDDALLVFRLVKSVGQLPNIIYLIAYDRQLAERTVSLTFPSEGPHYLEKIVQTAFDLPLPPADELRQSVLAVMKEIGCSPSDNNMIRYMNMFYDIVAFYITTPRTTTRLISTLRVTWPMVQQEADAADFLSIETLRLFEPNLYHAIRNNAEILTGISASSDQRSKEQRILEYDKVLFEGSTLEHQPRLKIALRRLFPRLEGVWGNTFYDTDYIEEWRRDRLICSQNYFSLYFRFSVTGEALSIKIVKKLIDFDNDASTIEDLVRQCISVRRSSGRSEASLLLEELNVHAINIPDSRIPRILEVLYKLGDELAIKADGPRAFETSDNRFRLHWLTNRLLLERMDVEKRSAILVRAASSAALGWLVDLAARCHRELHPRPGAAVLPKEPLMSTAAAKTILALARKRIRGSSRDEILRNPRALHILMCWRDFSASGRREVRRWVKQHLSDYEFVIELASILTSTAWSQTSGDRVAGGRPRVDRAALEILVDSKKFIARVLEIERSIVLPDSARHAIKQFQLGWEDAGH